MYPRRSPRKHYEPSCTQAADCGCRTLRRSRRLETCLSCDLIVAARNAKLGGPEVRHNLLASSARVRLPRRMPHHLAIELVLTVTYKEAAWLGRFGLVNRLVEPGWALEEAVKLAMNSWRMGPLALAASKEIMSDSMTTSGSNKQRSPRGRSTRMT
ncbi:hypothetical protein I6F16_36090 [Bradyrhizobium sp. IC4060]|uniref:enoyl-CoA hydratase-related protein n=1 Tax=Bradyrhizobium sp. IC4061 TaxID=2793808 RepID=UPI001CD2CD36|nr:hypothetical protein [Bradyrhizobium sp. IC4060]MCA1489125.1 hypothetical protein [Bradyrhizobium sp. IC4061]